MKRTVKIPSQIRLQTEFFEGFGMEELIKTIIVLAISSVISYFVYKITQTTLLATFLVIGSTVIAVVFVTKNRSGFSMLDNIKNIVKYELMQKEYKYERGNFNKSEK
jgi:hypothetical protein